MRFLTSLLKSLFRPRRGTQDADAADAALLKLLERHPQLADLGREQEPSLEALEQPFLNYTATVSPAGWAISLESAAAADALCRLMRPQRVLDLGSGFTSHVYRRYAAAAGHPCRVITVDDDAAWLEKTRGYLQANGLSTADLYTWDDFRARGEAPFDLVSHDMGTMQARGERLAEVLGYCAPSGLALLDDVEKADYARVVAETCPPAGFEVALLRAHTTDRYGRYAGIAFRP